MNLHLTEKAGPLKVWQWLAIVTVALLGWRLLHKKTATSSSTASSATSTVPVGVPPVVVNTFGGPAGPTTSSPTPVQAPSPVTNPGNPTPYQVAVADQADEQIAEAAGIPKSWLVYAGSDPFANRPNAGRMGYAPPTDLPTLNPAGAPAVYTGLANQVAPAGAQKVFGQTRDQTAVAVRQWSQHYVMGQS